MHRMAGLLLLGTSTLTMTAGANGQDAAPPQQNDSYFQAAAGDLQSRLNTQPITGPAKNVILFVADGMSIPTITAGRIYEGQKRGVDGESNNLAMDTFPYSALVKTYTHDAQVADSAPTAVAMTTGVKTRNDVIGVDQTVPVGDCAAAQGHEVKTIFEMAEDAGLATGIVSTARITHATPAATYAHVPNRDWEDDKSLADNGGTPGGACKDIADQLVSWPFGDGFEIALGGGRSYFLPASVADPEDEGKTGRRGDGRNLTEDWTRKSNNHRFVWNTEGLNAVDLASGAKVLGLFEGSHMKYEADRGADKGGEPSLAELTQKAITRLQQDEDGFVLLVEAGRVDHAHHDGNAARAMEDMVAFDAAIKQALEMTEREDTLIVVTADHSHTMNINGYPRRGNELLGLVVDVEGETSMAKDGKPYTTLSYSNGPGSVMPALPEDAQEGTEAEAVTRPDLTGVDTKAVDFKQQSLVPLSSETHGGDDVAVFAWGPSAHAFHGVVEQNLIYHVMAHAAGLPRAAGAEASTGAAGAGSGPSGTDAETAGASPAEEEPAQQTGQDTPAQ
ncbi:alkaline phosphatase [Antarcticirhabdus aurantiaca]|uniref:Alkaline phosphatase n=1 Tax=Antarcticirhabdus aurantiaca TaxID=2606717 RepID=A0ACD4NX11_9HYPH|nr:alkaline phosphatase [Antarcticirhabdus aurantiaca]WAJ31263.1 alkaline phosphatase [Jeongeuplla avenae]